MAKKIKEGSGYNRAMRNRGEDVGYPEYKGTYDYMPQDQYSDKAQERFINRRETRKEYSDFYRLEQERDQRAFERVKEMRSEFFGGVDPRRRKELADGGMIREDQQAMANLPRQAIHCEYPQAPFYQSPYMDDTRRGIDPRPDDNGYSMARFLNPEKNPE